MRISKELASQIASKLAEKKYKLFQDAAKKYSDYVLSEYKKQTPKSVLSCLKAHPEWITTESSVKLQGSGFNYEVVSVGERVVRNSNNNAYLNLSDKVIADTCVKLMRERDNAKQAWKDLASEIENALVNLRTTAQIEKHLPEAIPYLPPSEKLELAINFSDLRNKLK